MRAVAVLAIIIAHTSFFQRGTFGFDIFFVISGFCMMYVTQNSAKKLLIKRFIRIIPMYWLATVIRLILSPAPVYNQSFDLNLFFESLFFIPRNPQPLFNAGWSLNHLIAFYIIFKLACLINLKDRGKIAAAFLITWICSMQIFNLKYYYMPLPIEFILGIIAFEIIKYAYVRENKNTKYGNIIKNIVCVILCAGSLWYMTSYSAMKIIYLSGDWELMRPAVLGIPAMILVCGFCIFMKDKKIPKILIFLGNMSFSCYLWHIFVVAIAKLLLLKLNLIAEDRDFYLMNLPNFILMVAVVAITVALSWVSHKFIEVKFANWLRRVVVREKN